MHRGALLLFLSLTTKFSGLPYTQSFYRSPKEEGKGVGFPEEGRATLWMNPHRKLPGSPLSTCVPVLLGESRCRSLPYH